MNIDPELLPLGARSADEWETYIREADPVAAIFERAARIYEFRQECRARHGKQGGSRFAEFMFQRFGMAQATASHWAMLGAEAHELCDNVTKFAPDWGAAYKFTRLPKPAQKRLLEAGALIDRKAVTTERANNRRAVKLRSEGKSLRAIAEAISKSGHQLSHAAVQRILRDAEQNTAATTATKRSPKAR